MNITKEQFLEATYYLWTIEKQTSNGITGYNVYLEMPNHSRIKIYGFGAYWSPRKGYYWHTGWGSSRPLDIILDIGYTLGCNFAEIEQGKIKSL